MTHTANLIKGLTWNETQRMAEIDINLVKHWFDHNLLNTYKNLPLILINATVERLRKLLIEFLLEEETFIILDF